MISLYDYLGKAAGRELGTQVKTYAALKKTKIGFRDISNPVYKGKVMLYEREFLDEFFKTQAIFGNNR
jgi:hypothetical protein